MNDGLELDPKFLNEFLDKFMRPVLYPALAVSVDPETPAGKIIMQYFESKLAGPEKEWVSRQLSEPIINLFSQVPSPLESTINSWAHSPLPPALVYTSIVKITPHFRTITDIRLSDEVLTEHLSLLPISQLRLEGTSQLTDEGIALALSRLSPILQILELKDVESIGDATIKAVATLPNLKRLELRGLYNLTNDQMEAMFKGTLGETLEHMYMSTYDLSAMPALSKCNKLTYFHLANQKVQDVDQFCSLLESKVGHLNYLVLESLPWIKDEELQKLANLEVIKNLHSLYLHDLSITGQGILALAPALNKLEVNE